MSTISPLEEPIGYDAAVHQVSAYLKREFLSGKLSGGTRLPTVRALSRALKVSPAAVHAVYRRLREEGKVVATVGRGTFLTRDDAPGAEEAGKPISLALSCALKLPSDSGWSNAILSELLAAAGRAGRRIALIPVTGGSPDGGTTVERLLEEIDRVDGVVLLPPLDPVGRARVLEAYDAVGKPVIHVNAPSLVSTENFVSPDYYHACLALARASLAAGRRRFLYLGPVGDLASASVQQQISGLQTALALFEGEAEMRLQKVSEIHAEDGFEAMEMLLESGYCPDLVYTFGDYLAVGAREALLRHGLKVPEEVGVVGGTGLSESRGLLTVVEQPYPALAEAILERMLASLDAGGKPVPGRYLPVGFAVGASTLPGENERLPK
ncbi:MAG TPA: GntR family transcriptional regulator [Chthoniobacteraceae bacterium]|nr:GntR family transcriptional regulator [Chthoniobacteraceae bacterium]